MRLVKQKVQTAISVCSLRKLEAYLARSAGGIDFVHGSGRRKSAEQKEWERLDELRRRWAEYEEKLGIMGEGRNSYSKTDTDATFMRMKEDHMRNGQLKPGYNVQIAVNSEYITGIDVFSDRTDFGTLVPFLKTLRRQHGKKYDSVTADAGYERFGNYARAAQGLAGKYRYRARHLSAPVPLHSGGGCVWVAENRFWLSQISYARQGKRANGVVLSCAWFQSEKAVDEAGKRANADASLETRQRIV